MTIWVVEASEQCVWSYGIRCSIQVVEFWYSERTRGTLLSPGRSPTRYLDRVHLALKKEDSDILAFLHLPIAG